MTGEHLNVQARRVVTGVDAEGRSTIVSDELTGTRVATPAFTICGTWQVEAVPQRDLAESSFGGNFELEPPPAGFNHLITTFPPDSEYDVAAAYAESLASSGDAEATVTDDGGIPGLHQTETIDIVTVLSGEIYAVMETGETLLRPGDTLVQRGTRHAWSNRTDQPCTIVAVMLAATRT